MKNNMRYVLIGIIVLLLLGTGIFFVAGNKKTAQVSNPENQINQNSTGNAIENSNQSTLKDLMAKGIAQKCTFSDKMENVEMTGTMYLDGTKMRGDFNNIVEGKTISSHMIFENNTSYNWSEGQNTGMMFKMDPNEVKQAQNDSVKNQQPFDPNKSVDYKCATWIVDNSLFVPPANVKFSDLTQMTAPAISGNGQTAPNMCAACDNLSGDAKQQCLTALKCS